MVKGKLIAYTLLLVITTLTGCKEKTDRQMLERDMKKLEKLTNTDNIAVYKFVKIAVRSASAGDTLTGEYKEFFEELNQNARKINTLLNGSTNEISLLDTWRIYRNYKAMRQLIIDTDEDIFPTISEGLSTLNAQDYLGSFNMKLPLSTEKKLLVQNIEHAFLSIATMTIQKATNESLYECGKTQTKYLPDGELKSLLVFARSLVFFSNQLYYLSENELTENINWIDANHNVDASIVRTFFNWGTLSNQQAQTGWHAINVLLRGINRLMMDRNVDRERAYGDLNMFLTDMAQIGIDNEITWGIQAYVSLHNNDREKALAAFQKLNNSPLFGKNEKKVFTDAMQHIENRDETAKLQSLFDALFLGKITTVYVYSLIKEADLQKILQQAKVPNADKIITILNRTGEIVEQINALAASTKSFTNQAIEKGKNLLNGNNEPNGEE